jgi:hypothetical protein
MVFTLSAFLMQYSYLVSAIITAILSFLMALMLIILLSLKGAKRAKEIEKVLPDALQLIAANIRAGMTPDRALWVSARPEFGALEKEIRRIGSETLSGETLEEAFMHMGTRVSSKVLDRTIRLLVEGMESGGEIATLLTETANEIRAVEILDKEMTANVAMYTMFITFASLIGAPLLYGISTFFMEILTKMSPSLGAEAIKQSKALGVRTVGISTAVSPEFLFNFSLIAIIITTFFAALMVGLIKKGDEKRGFVYAPLFVVTGLAIFWIVRYAIISMFGSLIIL